MAIKVLHLFLVLSLCAGCSSAAKKAKLAKASELATAATEVVNIKTGPSSSQKYLVAKQITSNGENAQAYFSADAKRILYLSKKRPEHQQSQVYELTLSNLKERRLTFHDGEDVDANYSADQNYIYYSSTTDEIKEEHEAIAYVMKTYAPQLLKKKSQIEGLDFRPYEIYLSKLDGSQINRLTKSSGYDAEASMNKKGTKILFVSTRNGNADLYLMPFSISEWTKKSAAFERALEIERNISSTSPSKAVSDSRIVRLTNDTVYNSHPIFVPQTDKILWIKYSPDQKSSQLMLGNQMAKEVQALNSKVSLNLSPYFNPVEAKEFAFSSNRGDGVHFNLYTLDITGHCLKRLTESANDEILPAFSPDGKRLLFTSNRSGKNQIYLIDYISPHVCLDELP